MKVEVADGKVALVPQNGFDILALKMIAEAGIQSVSFRDAWNNSGPLDIILKKHPFEER